MFRIWIFAILIHLILMIGVTFAHHANEKYCFNCNHKYKIGDKENDTYEFEFDLETTVSINYRDSIGRTGTIDLEKKVEKQISDKKTGLVSYILFENNKILIDENRKSKVSISCRQLSVRISRIFE